MIDQSKFEDLYKIGGGVFRTTVLIQKRLKELNRGARRLIEEESKNPIETVMHEIEARRLELIPDTVDNRELIRAEIEKMTLEAKPLLEVSVETTPDELDRRIASALAKDRK